MLRIIALVSVLIAVGCSHPKISVKDEWAKGVRNYALVPIYPMREDVFVGDVRIHSSKGASYSLNSRLLHHLAAESSLMRKEGSLPYYPSSKTVKAGNGGEAWAQPTGKIGPSGKSERLRLAALPKIDLVRITGFNAGANGLLGAFQAVFGVGVEEERTLLISLSGVETMEWTDQNSVPMFSAYLTDSMADNREAFEQIVCAAGGTFGDPTLESTKISLVTRVVYARGVEYSYGDNFVAALKAAASKGDTIPASPVSGGDAGEGTPADVDLSKITDTKTPGVTASFKRVSKDSIYLKEIYERPMAFGADTLTIAASSLGLSCSPSTVPGSDVPPLKKISPKFVKTDTETTVLTDD